MPAATTFQARPRDPAALGGIDFRDLQRQLAEVIESDASSTDRQRTVLMILLRIASARGTLLFDTGSTSTPMVVAEVWRNEEVDWMLRNAAAACATQALTEGLAAASAVRGTGDVRVIALPVHTSGARANQCLCILCQSGRAPSPEVLILLGQTAAEALHAHALRSGLIQAAALVELLDRVAGTEDYPRALQRLAEELQRHLGCHRVCIGDSQSVGIRVRAISGEPGFDRRSAKVLSVEEAMNASVRLRAALATAELPGDAITGHDALAEAANSLDATYALAAPLFSREGDPLAAWMVAWKDRPDPASVNFLETSAPYLGTFLQILRSGKPGRILGPVAHAWRKASQNRRRLYIGGALLLGALLFLPLPYRIAADAKLQPVTYRIVAAPFDGILRESHVQPGSVVRKGELLAELDGKELRWQLAEALAQRARALKQRDTARARGDAAATQVAALEAASLDAEVALLEHRSDNLRVIAPINGIVLTGDLERARGAPVSVGQRLFEIAPLARMLTEISLSQRDLAQVKEGSSLRLRLEPDPGKTLATVVHRVRPRSEQIDGENVFVCEAYLENTEGSLRPGMRGKARIAGPWRTLAWIVFHRLWEFLQLRIW